MVVPGQFRASTTDTHTVGAERLYQALQFDVYYAPFDNADFVAPSIWQATSASGGGGSTFDALVTDDSGGVTRVVALYRLLNSPQWTKVELNYDAATHHATGVVANLNGAYEYLLQAVDGAGNVALALDHGLPFQGQTQAFVYLPLVRR